MNAAHLHLLSNHAPIIGDYLTLIILLVALLRKNVTILQVGLYILIGSAAMVFVADTSGEGAEEIVEHLPGVSHKLIHQHEEAAEWAVRALAIAAALGAFTLWKSTREKAIPKWWAWGTFVVTLWATSVLTTTGLLGGKIMHPEIEATQPMGADHEHEEADEHKERPEQPEKPE